jgi:hypothetical protein
MSMQRDDAYHIARLLLLVDGFSDQKQGLAGLTKLAKLDFLLRYPAVLQQLLRHEGGEMPEDIEPTAAEQLAVESPMIRYKYGPWDNRYYRLVGQLVGLGLVEVDHGRGLSFRSTASGSGVAASLSETPEWALVWRRINLLRRYFNTTGNKLKQRIYQELPQLMNRPHRRAI